VRTLAYCILLMLSNKYPATADVVPIAILALVLCVWCDIVEIWEKYTSAKYNNRG